MLRGIVGTCCALIAVVSLLVTHLVTAQDDPFGGSNAPAASPSLNPPPASSQLSAEERIDLVLDLSLKTPLQYDEMPLSEVLEALREEYEFPIVIDAAALDELAISLETEVTVNLRNISLRSALDLMLKQPGLEDLSYAIDSEVLLITTTEKVNERLITRVYRIDDLITSAAQYLQVRDHNRYASYEHLIDILASCIERDSWAKNGTGEGGIHALAPGMLVVSQTPYVHELISDLLQDLRATKQSVLTNAAADVAAAKPITRGFAIKVEFGKNPEMVRQTLADAIVRSVDWEIEKSKDLSPEDVWVNVLPERVLVRHLPAVTQQVQAALADMQLTRNQHGGGGRGGGR